MQRYQAAYEARFDRGAGKATLWEAGGTVRVSCTCTEKFTTPQAAKVDAGKHWPAPPPCRCTGSGEVDAGERRPENRVESSAKVGFEASSGPVDSASPTDPEL